MRTGEQQTECFDDEDSAKVFRDAVDEAGQHWPPGWVKGKGYIDPTATDELRYRFDRWAVESVENRTASKRYKQQRIRALEMYMFPTFGNCDIRSAEHFSKATVGAWVNKMQVLEPGGGMRTPSERPSPRPAPTRSGSAPSTLGQGPPGKGRSRSPRACSGP
ncbi:hypothetical protein [Streptomyces sp. NPDC058394]|uniref:hypothetical protein n=1 Tax=unclassified Streptomyces TaxID=2593676 RepID=UPI003646FE31